MQFPIMAMARAFSPQPNHVCHALQKGDAIPKGRGEHPNLEDDTEEQRLD
jgi:hypothetical protein